jgi:hypothetical protein
MEILNQLEKNVIFQVMKFLLKSVTSSNDQKQNTWKTDLKKYIYEILYQKNLKEKSPLTSSSNSSKSSY